MPLGYTASFSTSHLRPYTGPQALAGVSVYGTGGASGPRGNIGPTGLSGPSGPTGMKLIGTYLQLDPEKPAYNYYVLEFADRWGNYVTAAPRGLTGTHGPLWNGVTGATAYFYNTRDCDAPVLSDLQAPCGFTGVLSGFTYISPTFRPWGGHYGQSGATLSFRSFGVSGDLEIYRSSGKGNIGPGVTYDVLGISGPDAAVQYGTVTLQSENELVYLTDRKNVKDADGLTFNPPGPTPDYVSGLTWGTVDVNFYNYSEHFYIHGNAIYGVVKDPFIINLREGYGNVHQIFAPFSLSGISAEFHPSKSPIISGPSWLAPADWPEGGSGVTAEFGEAINVTLIIDGGPFGIDFSEQFYFSEDIKFTDGRDILNCLSYDHCNSWFCTSAGMGFDASVSNYSLGACCNQTAFKSTGGGDAGGLENPKIKPKGACCWVNGSCTLVPLDICQTHDEGIYQGDGTHCNPPDIQDACKPMTDECKKLLKDYYKCLFMEGIIPVEGVVSRTCRIKYETDQLYRDAQSGAWFDAMVECSAPGGPCDCANNPTGCRTSICYFINKLRESYSGVFVIHEDLNACESCIWNKLRFNQPALQLMKKACDAKACKRKVCDPKNGIRNAGCLEKCCPNTHTNWEDESTEPARSNVPSVDCQDYVLESYCDDLGGGYNWFIEQTCSGIPCEDSDGSCCINIVDDDPFCVDGVDINEPDCLRFGGVWRSGTPCSSEFSCGEPCGEQDTGACCRFDPAGDFIDCYNGMIYEDCVNINPEQGTGEYQGDFTYCEAINCEGGVTPTGACCTSPIDCIGNVTSLQCNVYGGNFFGGQACGAVNCDICSSYPGFRFKGIEEESLSITKQRIMKKHNILPKLSGISCNGTYETIIDDVYKHAVEKGISSLKVFIPSRSGSRCSSNKNKSSISICLGCDTNLLGEGCISLVVPKGTEKRVANAFGGVAYTGKSCKEVNCKERHGTDLIHTDMVVGKGSMGMNITSTGSKCKLKDGTIIMGCDKNFCESALGGIYKKSNIKPDQQWNISSSGGQFRKRKIRRNRNIQ